MPEVLAIQFRTNPQMLEQEQHVFERDIGAYVRVHFQNAFAHQVQWDAPAEVLAGYDAVILGGSGEYDLDGGRALDDPARQAARDVAYRIRPFLSYVLEREMPTLGICFGHQLMGLFAGSAVAKDEVQGKTGTYSLTKTADATDDPLFADIPETFQAQYAHKDVIDTKPVQAAVLAESSQCRFGALRYGRAAYSVQFHPELNADDMLHRLRHTSGYLPEDADGTQFIQPAPHATRVLENFVLHIIGAGAQNAV
jgi:GMP synthase (glutamine-hydrolysing)